MTLSSGPGGQRSSAAPLTENVAKKPKKTSDNFT